MTSWTSKLTSLLQDATFWIVVVAIAAFVLSTGLLWPVAAIASSVLTTYVHRFLDKISQEHGPAEVASEGQSAENNHARYMKAPRSCRCDEQASTCIAVQHDKVVSGNGVGRPSMVSASLGEDVTQSFTIEGSDDARNQGSASVIKPLVEASLDRVSISLTRSEADDWGFAWQVGAYGAKRLILVNIRTSSPMDVCNASRQANGQPTIASGDELIRIGKCYDFDAMQKALASEMSLEMTFLKAQAVPPVVTNSTARRQKTLLPNFVVSKIPADEKSPETEKDVHEGPDALPTASCPELLAESLNDFIQTTKNTFLEFRLRGDNRTDRLSRSDPTPVRCAYTHAFCNDGNNREEKEEQEEASQIEGHFDNNSVSLHESSSSHETFPRFDTIDVHDFGRKDVSLQDSTREPSSLDKTTNQEIEIDHYQTTFTGLGDSSEYGRHCQYVTEEEDDVSMSVLVPRFDTIGCHILSAPSHASSSRDLPHLLAQPLQVETSLREHESVEFRTAESSTSNEMLVSDCQTGFPKRISIEAPAETRSSVPYAGSLSFRSPSLPGYSANNITNIPPGLWFPPSDFCSAPFVATSWKEPSNVSSLMRQQQLVPNIALPSQCESSLHSRASVIPEIGFTTARNLSTACCFSARNVSESVANRPSQVSNGSADSIESIQMAGSSADTYIPRSAANVRRVLHKKTRSKERSTVLPQIGKDWYCPNCFDLQFCSNFRCRMCGLPRDQGVIELWNLDADRFLQGHRVTEYVATRFQNLGPEMQQTVMSGGSLHGARDPTAVLADRIRRAEALVCASSSQGSSPVKLGFDRKQTVYVRP